MSYYDKYLKYKNKYLQYKNSLGLNMQGGNNLKYPSSNVNIHKNDIFHINNLSATPDIGLVHNSYKNNKILSISQLSDTPKMSEFAGGAYINKRQIKSINQKDKLLKLLERYNETDSHGSSAKTEEELLDDFRENPPTLRDMNKHKYFATESEYSSSSDS
jgi:hypothetical protein